MSTASSFYSRTKYIAWTRCERNISTRWSTAKWFTVKQLNACPRIPQKDVTFRAPPHNEQAQLYILEGALKRLPLMAKRSSCAPATFFCTPNMPHEAWAHRGYPRSLRLHAPARLPTD